MRALLLAGVVAFGWAGSAQAAFIETALETSTGVVFTGTGSINTTGLSSFITFSGSSITPNEAVIFSGQGAGFRTLTGPSNFGSGGSSFASSRSGDAFFLFAPDEVFGVPNGYISGSALNSSLTFAGATFASLGVTLGTYVYNVNSGTNADTITVQIGPVATQDPSAVPEPASLALLGLGAAGVIAGRRKRKAA